MTKAKRVLSLVLVALMCLSLCSCKELDEMRAHHAIMQEDGTVLWNQAVYKLLPEFDYEVVDAYGLYPESDIRWIAVTEPEIPVLLSEYFGSRMYVYNQQTLLFGWSDERSYYCREDCYDRVLQQLMEIQQISLPDGNTYYVGMALWFADGGDKRRIDLTSAQQEAVETIIETVVPTTRDLVIHCDAVDVHGVSQHNDLLQCLFEIAWDWGNGYELVFQTEREEYYYPVPSEYNEMLYELLIPVWEAQGLMEEKFPQYEVTDETI